MNTQDADTIKSLVKQHQLRQRYLKHEGSRSYQANDKVETGIICSEDEVNGVTLEGDAPSAVGLANK